MAMSTYSTYETLAWFPLVVGREDPELLTQGLDFDGWMSEPNATYPIDVILGFEHICDVYKVYLGVADHLVPSKVEFRTGKPRFEDEDPTYQTARSVRYDLKGTVRFSKRSTDIDEKETKTVFVDSECQYLWILLHAPHSSRLNPTNQIRITELTVEGYLLPRQRTPRTSRSMDTFRRDVLTPLETPPPRRRRTPERTPEKRRRRRSSRASTGYSTLATPSIALESRNGRTSRVSSILGGSIREAEGWKSNGENLASDPLMTVRLVRNLLSKKRKRALKYWRGGESEPIIWGILKGSEFD